MQSHLPFYQGVKGAYVESYASTERDIVHGVIACRPDLMSVYSQPKQIQIMIISKILISISFLVCANEIDGLSVMLTFPRKSEISL